MFCPQCGSTQSDEMKFCKACGANLAAVRKVVKTRDTEGKFDWNKTWVAEMMLSGEESVRRAKEIERLQGLTPEVKRRNEIKAGVITASAGIGAMILIAVIMGGIIASGKVTDGAAEILSRLWIAGVVPVFVGAALIINGVFVTPRHIETTGDATDPRTRELGQAPEPGYLAPADTNELVPSGFSVTDETTKHLKVRQR